MSKEILIIMNANKREILIIMNAHKRELGNVSQEVVHTKKLESIAKGNCDNKLKKCLQ